MWETILKVARELAVFSFASIFLIQFWLGARNWRQFFLKKPYYPDPAWASRLTHYLLWAAIPWSLNFLIHSALDLKQHGKAKVFAAGFIAFCCIIGLVSRYFGSDEGL